MTWNVVALFTATRNELKLLIEPCSAIRYEPTYLSDISFRVIFIQRTTY